MIEILLRISPYSVRMRENMDQKNSEYGHFSCSDRCLTGLEIVGFSQRLETGKLYIFQYFTVWVC